MEENIEKNELLIKMTKKTKRGKKKIILEEEQEEPKVKSQNDLIKDFEVNKCNDPENTYSKECNKFLLRKEFLEREELKEHPDENEYLYPNLNDPLFNVKIAEKTEFAENQYDGKIHKDIKEHAEMLSNADFELAPHQAFVRNFLSFQTPYNSLLLYHSLGTGKCLKLGTPIIMYDGSIKEVQNIVVGDLLMGDDSTPRLVTSLARGKDKMYDVINDKGEKYTVNEEHIL
jgi:hypothetical protein